MRYLAYESSARHIKREKKAMSAQRLSAAALGVRRNMFSFFFPLSSGRQKKQLSARKKGYCYKRADALRLCVFTALKVRYIKFG